MYTKSYKKVLSGILSSFMLGGLVLGSPQSVLAAKAEVPPPRYI